MKLVTEHRLNRIYVSNFIFATFKGRETIVAFLITPKGKLLKLASEKKSSPLQKIVTIYYTLTRKQPQVPRTEKSGLFLSFSYYCNKMNTINFGKKYLLRPNVGTNFLHNAIQVFSGYQNSIFDIYVYKTIFWMMSQANIFFQNFQVQKSVPNPHWQEIPYISWGPAETFCYH